jgi:hypothetical protein
MVQLIDLVLKIQERLEKKRAAFQLLASVMLGFDTTIERSTNTNLKLLSVNFSILD